MSSLKHKTSIAKKDMNVVIVGGSICGLMHGIMLIQLGHNVHILEQSTELRTQAAGMNAGPNVRQFLNAYDLCQREYGLPSAGVQFLTGLNGTLRERYFLKVALMHTSWEVLYYRLRANFDGLKSKYCPETLPVVVGRGKATYDMGTRVTDLSYSSSEGHATVTYDDVVTGGARRRHADLVIGADGFNSVTRRLASKVPVKRTYAGYLTWRGTVSEMEMSEETVKFFEDHTTIWMGSQTHCVVYIIPGDSGDLTPGSRMVNLCWYCNYSEDSQELRDILTDVSNYYHRNAVAAGKLRDEVWQKQKSHGISSLPAPFADLVSKINQPFVQTISDTFSPQASFFDGRLLLVGDALTLFRPHAALSTDQAAMNCLALEKVMKGEMSINEWERKVLGYGYTTWLASRAMGSFYQFGPRQWIPSALQVLVASAGQWISKGMVRFQAVIRHGMSWPLLMLAFALSGAYLSQAAYSSTTSLFY